MQQALDRLAENPESGRSAESIRGSYWTLRVGRHLVFCTYAEDVVSMRRVLHDQMDFLRHL
ncbi:MAG: hypothetical protein CMJ94_14200 [Planctomycetes bacterium]|nr:hypothetical protein [Planctomycetota bacterium]